MRLMEGEHVGPFNLGNPGEFTMLELAKVSIHLLTSRILRFCAQSSFDIDPCACVHAPHPRYRQVIDELISEFGCLTLVEGELFWVVSVLI